jgi:hypothetical protein
MAKLKSKSRARSKPKSKSKSKSGKASSRSDVPARAEKIIKAFDALLPVEFVNTQLVGYKETYWVPTLGVVSHVSMHDKTSYQGPNADLLVVGKDELDRADEVLARLKALFRDWKKNGFVHAIEWPLEKSLGLVKPKLGPTWFAPSAADNKRRAAALKVSLGRFKRVAEHYRKVWGLRLPKHVAVWHAFRESLTPLERSGMDVVGVSPGGITYLFNRDNPDVKTRDHLDPRLDSRFRCDPPEFVTIAYGNSDGEHFGLWHEEPDELPQFIAFNWARDSAETDASEQRSMIEIALHRLKEMQQEGPEYQYKELAVWAARCALEAFAEADRKALEEDGLFRKLKKPQRPWITGGMGPLLPASKGDTRGSSYDEQKKRYEAIRAESKQVDKWIEEARNELAAGKPAFALVLGRELHWHCRDAYQAVCTELLVGAYQALGRQALAEIVKVHHANRDLPHVSVFV